jgi:molybdate transport system substrate-binding protein
MGESWRGKLRASVAMLLLCALAGCRGSHQTVLIVSAAASLTDAIQEIEAGYGHDHPNVELRNNFGSSGTLAGQIEEGAPVDVFLSAASKPMDDLEARGLIVAGSRRDLLRNSLVLIVPRGSHLGGFKELEDASVRTIALGDPESVPAGRYGKETLVALHLMDSVQRKLVLAKDVRQVLAYVETGNADAGLVYATDAAISSNVRVAATAPESSHDPIVYPAAAVASGHHEAAAREFVEYLESAAAKAAFEKRGFTITTQ